MDMIILNGSASCPLSEPGWGALGILVIGFGGFPSLDASGGFWNETGKSVVVRVVMGAGESRRAPMMQHSRYTRYAITPEID